MAIPHSWPREFRDFLLPHLKTLSHVRQRVCLPKYIRGLLAPLERKSTEPIAEHLGVPYQRLHHFLNVSTWDAEAIEHQLTQQAQTLCGGKRAVLIIDDTALPKSGDHSVGVAPQYCGAQRRVTNCQALVTLTLADGPVFAPLCMRLFLPQTWTEDPARCAAAGVPLQQRAFASKQELALQELDCVRVAGVMFGVVVADAGYGSSVAFRHGLTERGLTWAVGIASHHGVYSLNVTLAEPVRKRTGRPAKHPTPSETARPVQETLDRLPPHHWHTVKGAKKSRWIVVRARLADGPEISRGVRLPGEEVWVIGEKRRGGEIKYYVSNHPEDTPKAVIVRQIKARWACETNHGQAKEELGLDHFEGRSWRGLRHHVVLVMLTMLFLQWVRARTRNGEAFVFTMPLARREASRSLERVRRGRCPHCGERIRGASP